MQRVAFKMKLFPGFEAEYKKRHDEIWPDLVALLKETGVSGNFRICTSTGAPVEETGIYVIDPERGPRPARPSDTSPRVTGKTILDMEREDYSDAATQTQSKFLMRFLLAHHLGGVPLNTRQILIDLMQL